MGAALLSCGQRPAEGDFGAPLIEGAGGAKKSEKKDDAEDDSPGSGALLVEMEDDEEEMAELIANFIDSDREEADGPNTRRSLGSQESDSSPGGLAIAGVGCCRRVEAMYDEASDDEA